MRQAAESDAWVISGVNKVQNDIIVTSMVKKSSDENIKVETEHYLTELADIDTNKLHLSVYNGWVTLKGDVDMFWKKIRAGEIASLIPGVTGVTNELTVVPTDNIEDQEIAEAIVRGLERNPLLDPNSIHFAIEDGQAFLSGSVPSGAALQSVSKFVENISGIRGIHNNLIVNQCDT